MSMQHQVTSKAVASFGIWLRRQRRSQGLTQAELGDRLGYSATVISKMETGERRPSPQVAELVAEWLGIEPNQRIAFLRFATAESDSDGLLIPDTAPAGIVPLTACSPAQLPVPLTQLIGREVELRTVRGWLLGETVRLVTLTGPPGIGKTRLSLQLALDLKDQYDDGVIFVALASVRDPALVPVAIGRALGVADVWGRSQMETLTHHLHDKHLLLVLDNFEQVLAAGPLVAELLTACPGVKAVVTSREPLQVLGEQRFPLPPLGLPDLAQLPDLDALSRYSAIALFLEQAQAVDPKFVLTAENARAVVAICARLDRLPLAIELVAARIALLPLPGILAQLERGELALSMNGIRDLPCRHRSLREAIDWSYQLLDPAEQELFAQLGVFAGGCTVEAAEAVFLGRDDPETGQVLEGISSLLHKSLLQRDRDRYFMLQTLREYAAERLVASDDADAVRGLHVAYYLALAETAEGQMRGPEQKCWLERLAGEHGNLTAALEWLFERGQMQELARLSSALRLYWLMRRHLDEGRMWLDRTLALSQALPVSLRAKVAGAAGILAESQGDYERAMTLLSESRTLDQQLEDMVRVNVTIADLGLAALDQGDAAGAAKLFAEGLALSRDLADQRSIASFLNNLGLTALQQRDYHRARAMLEESLTLQRAMSNMWGVAASLDTLGRVALAEGEACEARVLFGESLGLLRELGDTLNAAVVLQGVAAAAVLEGQAEGAAQLCGAAEGLCETVGAALSPADRAAFQPYLESARTELGEAGFAAAWSTGKALPPERAIANALEYCNW